MTRPSNSSSITNVDSFGSSYDRISFHIKAFWFVIHSSTLLLLTLSSSFWTDKLHLNLYLKKNLSQSNCHLKTLRNRKMAKLVFWCQLFHCCSLFLHSYTDFSIDSNKFLDWPVFCWHFLHLSPAALQFVYSWLFIFVKIVWQWNIIQYFFTFPKLSKCFNLFPSPILLRGNSFPSLPRYFFAGHSSTGVGGCEDDESLFDNVSSETWEEDAEKLTLFQFTATVPFFDIISYGDNGDDAKCLVWSFQELLAQ